jgi:hypothetical protein
MMDTTPKKMIGVKMKLADSMVGNGMGDELRMSVLKMMEKIEKWNEELELMMEEKHESIVACCKSNDGTPKARRYRFRKRSEKKKLTLYLELKKSQ